MPCQTSEISARRGDARVPHARTALAGCLIAALGLAGAAPPAMATVVNSCGERIAKGITTLRYAVTHAADGDTIDLSQLTCSTITLTGGEIPVTVNNLTIQASAAHPVTVDAGGSNRVFEHIGTGTLTLQYLTLQNGHAYGVYSPANDGYGGCVRSNGALFIEHSTLTGCSAIFGGASASVGNTLLVRSVLTGNSVHDTLHRARGGAVYAKGGLTALYDTIDNNQSQYYSGGIYAKGSVVIDHTSVSGNSANYSVLPSRCSGIGLSGQLQMTYSTVRGNALPPTAGADRAAICCTNLGMNVKWSTIADNDGLGIDGYPVGFAQITSSTISGNTGGGVRIMGLRLANSTVSGNSGNGIDVSGVLYGTTYLFSNTIAFNTGFGARVSGALDVESSILFGNGSALPGGPIDLALLGFAVLASGGNIVGNTTAVLNGTLTGDPQLVPLAFHGGAVKTHALLADSLAVDAGTNPDHDTYDARGAGFDRFVGAKPDIGAYERQINDDELFYGGFD